MKVFRLTLMAAMALTIALVSCEKPVPIEDETEPIIEVTDEAIDGCWELTHFNGAETHDGAKLYIDIDTKEHRFEMWDNIGSMYLVQTTGTYTITKEEDSTYTLSGTYDNGLGDWNEEYRIVMLPGERMQWWSRTTGTCLQFVFAMNIPEEFYN